MSISNRRAAHTAKAHSNSLAHTSTVPSTATGFASAGEQSKGNHAARLADVERRQQVDGNAAPSIADVLNPL